MNLRTASLADVGPAEVDELRTIGETLFVERKVMAKPVRDILGPAVASFANTLGGWVLLGVEDDRGAEPGSVKGWAPKGRASAQDYVRDLLQNNVDPVPPFAAKVVHLEDGQSVGVVRVAESVDVPHVVAPTGSVWTRGQGGKEPVTSYRDLMALAERGRAARAKADERLISLQHVEATMRPSPGHPSDAAGDDGQTLIVRIAPIMVPGTFADAALSEAVADQTVEQLSRALRAHEHDQSVRCGPVEPLARGLHLSGARRHPRPNTHSGFDIVLDAGGVAAGRFAWYDEDTGESAEDVIGYARLACRACASLLESCGAIGRCLARCDYASTNAERLNFGAGGYGTRRSRLTVMTEDLLLPLDDFELDRVAGRWLRELARECGLSMWETVLKPAPTGTQ